MADRNLTTMRRHPLITTREGMRLSLPPSDLFPMTSIPSVVDPFLASTSQEFPLGAELWYAERKFRYSKNGGVALVVARLCQSVVPLVGHIDEVIGEPAVGAVTIDFTPNTITTDDMAADEFADGYLYINDDTGEGYAYRIKSHPAITGGVLGVITLYDPILVAPGANATATIVHNRWRNVIIHTSVPTALYTGVTVIAVAANSYCWLQTKGPCPVLVDGTVVIYNKVVASTTIDGAVIPSASTGADSELAEIGEVMAVNADTEEALIWLNIND